MSIDMISVLSFAVLIFSIILHEIAHGGAAYALGDPTAYRAGRLTLNPIPHIDLMGSIVLPAILVFTGSPFLIGWAKPVPINPAYFRNLRLGIVLTGAAGPATNLAIAALAAAAWKLLVPTQIVPAEPVGEVLVYASVINIVLAVFNLVPIPPLDGSRIVMGLLPRRLAYAYGRLERYGMLIVLGLLVAGGMTYVVTPVARFLIKILFS